MEESIPMTIEGYNKIKAEIEHMDNVLMPQIAEKIAAARAEGDLKENAEYHGQREAQGHLQARINFKKSQLARARIVDVSQLPKDEVVFGSTVRVKDLDFDDEETFTLVGAGEEDYDKGRILISSPFGQGLLGKKVGDKVEIKAPKGTLKFQILEIRTEP